MELSDDRDMSRFQAIAKQKSLKTEKVEKIIPDKTRDFCDL